MSTARGDSRDRFCVIFEDITERKRAEEALRRERDFAESVIGTAQAIILILDTKGHIVYINPYMEEISGYNLDEVKGKDWFETFLPSHIQDSVRSLFQKAIGDIQTRGNVSAIITKDGRERLIEWYDKTLKNADGSIEGLLAIGQDVTDRKRVEEALRESEEKFRSLVEHSLEGICILDLQGTILFANNAAARTIEADDCAGLIGRNVMEFIAPESREDVVNDFIQVSQGHDAYLAQYNAISAKGNKFYVESIGKVISYEGKTADLISIRDITERKRAEEALKNFNEELEMRIRERTAELEHTNILLEDEVIKRTRAEESVRKSLNERELLLREVHHRVGNNLQIMLSLIRLQSQNMKDPGLLDNLGEFQNRIRAMAHVHERMYRAEDISRIDLSELCAFLGKSLFKSYKVDPRHIRLNVEMKDLQVGIDYAIPISLIINELVSNAIKHAFPQGTSGEITIGGRREADTLVLSVRDTGIGIPEDLDWMRSTQSLGHRLVVSLVEQLNGTIELDRTTGTAFNIVVKEKP